MSKKSFKHTEYSLRRCFNATYLIHAAYATDLINPSWKETTTLLVLPGGRDVFYMEKLRGPGNQNIRQFVEDGGSVLGICAGAFYCGNRIEFAINTPFEFCQERHLQFFPGTVRGPLFASFDYTSLEDARSVKICKDNRSFFYAYYHSGGYFVDAYDQLNTNVIATYDGQKKFPAIIECTVGKGKALLSGVHFEYAPELLNVENPHIRNIIPKLKKYDLQRLEMFKYALDRLAI